MNTCLPRAGIIGTFFLIFITGCSGSSDSGTEGVARWAGTYSAVVANIGGGSSPGSMTIKSDGKATGSFPGNIAVTGTVDVAGGVRMSGDKTPEGQPTTAILMTGKITGISAAKSLTDGKVSFPTLGDQTTKWTAQCISGCG